MNLLLAVFNFSLKLFGGEGFQLGEGEGRKQFAAVTYPEIFDSEGGQKARVLDQIGQAVTADNIFS